MSDKKKVRAHVEQLARESQAQAANPPSDNPLVGNDTAATLHNVIYVLRAAQLCLHGDLPDTVTIEDQRCGIELIVECCAGALEHEV